MSFDGWGPYFVLALACAGGVAVSLAGEYRTRAPFTAAGKVIAASAYLGAALSLGALETRYGRFVVVAMSCCWLGDLLLVSRNSRPLFMAGLTAFLTGHLVYIAAFVVRGTSPTAVLVASVPAFLCALLVARWLNPHLDARLVIPVRVYIGAITGMVIIAVGTFQAHGNSLLLAGAVLFYVSDLAVARNRFVAPGFANRAWGLPLYFTAQLLLAATVAN